jgi:sulfide:quinone oxidoreductase
LSEICADHGAKLHRGRLEAVNHDRSAVSVRGGPSLRYDELFVAVGARPRDWLAGAVRFGGPEDVARMRTIVDDLTSGRLSSIVFTAPAARSWTLPLYELALLTSAHVAEHGRGDVHIALVTPERDPLDAFGPAAAAHVRLLCANRGIELRVKTRAIAFTQGSLQLERGGALPADRVVALPDLVGDPLPGLPYDAEGFVPVDEHGAVRGLPGVYAAGDGIAYPIKQGGLATQQADAAAEAIAAALGAAIEPQPVRATLRGQLLTGLGPTYLSAAAPPAAARDSTVAVNPLWWPPSKIAGRYLAPYLTRHAAFQGAGRLEERPTTHPSTIPSDAPPVHGELRELALDFAESDAAGGDYRSALRWLEAVEQLDGLLSPALAGKQTAWRRQLA